MEVKNKFSFQIHADIRFVYLVVNLIGMPEKLSVIITGATGVAGSGVLAACLNHPGVEKVSSLTRRNTGNNNEKLHEIIHTDFLDYSKIENQLSGHNACFWCLGTPILKIKKEEDYHRVTYDFTMEAAKVLEKLNPGMVFCYLSAMGSDETQNSRTMAVRIKGKAESDLGNFNFRLFKFRPGLINPVKGYKGGAAMAKLIYPFIRNSQKYCVEAEEMGEAMINAALFGSEIKTLENRDIRNLAKANK